MRRAGILAAAALLWAAVLSADGGAVRLREDAGVFSVTVFVTPEAPTVGTADVSVLVQDRTSGAVLLDAAVEIGVRLSSGDSPRLAAAAPGRNRLLKAALVELPAPGDWSVEVHVSRGDATASVVCVLPVGPSRTGRAGVWPFLLFPPVAVAVFALRGRIRRR